MYDEVTRSLNEIVAALRANGYNKPYAQLKAYAEPDNPRFITRFNNAGERIKAISKETIMQFIADKEIYLRESTYDI